MVKTTKQEIKSVLQAKFFKNKNERNNVKAKRSKKLA